MDKSAGNRAATKENKIILWGKQEVKRITQTESNKAAADKAARWVSLTGKESNSSIVLKVLHECMYTASAVVSKTGKEQLGKLTYLIDCNHVFHSVNVSKRVSAFGV